METDLQKIKTLGKLRGHENERFRIFLKHRIGRKTDEIVHRLNKEVSAQIDCTACGNCCSSLSPYLSQHDLEQLSIATNKPVAEVIEQYTENDDSGISLKQVPCCFLKDHKCTVYAHRPETCASFPHLHKPDFNSRLRRTIDNYSICPIIFNVIERLKVELRFEQTRQV